MRRSVGVVVDTDVASFLFKRDTRAQLYRPHLAGRAWVISFMTLTELRAWGLERNWGPALRARLTRHLRRYLVQRTVEGLCQRWAAVLHGRRRAGRPIATADAWIAATALYLGIPLVTHNAVDYQAIPRLTVLTAATP